MKFTLILVCSWIVFFGCQKKETGEITTVTFTMPDLSGHGTQNFYQRAASAPATIDEVNCFAVMVSGPEPFMSRTSCPVVDSSSANISAQKRIGLVRGLVPSGGTVSFPVPAGPQRQFTLLGVKADPLSACLDFMNPNISQDYTSQLFIVGESSFIDLPPGATVSVPIKLPASGTAFSTGSPRIGECSGPDSPSNLGRILPTKTQVVKDQFPYSILKSSSCNAVTLNFVDDFGRNGPTITSQNVILERAEVSTAGVVSPFASFPMFTDPNCTNSLTTEFNIPANTRNFPVFFSSSASPSVSGFQFRLRPGTTAPVSLYPATISETFLIAATGTASIEVLGTRRVLPDMCYNMVGNFKTTDLTDTTGSAYTPTYASAESIIFPGKFCTNTAIANGTAFSITPDTKFDFSMRFTQDTFTSTYISLTPTVTSASTMAAKYQVQVVGGSYNPTFLRPELPAFIPAATAGCFGPFQVLVENEKGGALVTEGTIALSFTVGDPNVGIYNNSLCNQNYASFFTSDYRRSFYIGVSTTAVVANTVLTFKSQGLINHPSTPTNTTFAVSLTTSTNLLFK